RPGHPLGLGIVGNTARHVEEAADGDVLPRWILRQPVAERVIDRQLSRRLELEHYCHGERLRSASHLVSVSWSTGPASGSRPTFPEKASIAGPAAPKLI